jgi:hypothetical protein
LGREPLGLNHQAGREAIAALRLTRWQVLKLGISQAGKLDELGRPSVL